MTCNTQKAQKDVADVPFFFFGGMIKMENGVVKGLWKNYLPGLVNWVLQMSTQEMREYLLNGQGVVRKIVTLTLAKY